MHIKRELLSALYAKQIRALYHRLKNYIIDFKIAIYFAAKNGFMVQFLSEVSQIKYKLKNGFAISN